MRIYSMTATFGKLEQQTLTLEPGLNIITAPNEWGKSTWCAFLSAMLYGMDTRSHTTKTVLADKERYAPWSGSPMSGSMELHWNGRDITVQRHTKGRVPLGEFSAFETHTGLPVPELTAANCGQLLLGVEKSVFERSAFLRGRDLTVVPDEMLRRRLNGLVTTGDESGTAETLARKLRELKNRCRANRSTGLLPEALERKAALERSIAALEELEQRKQELENLRKTFRRRQAMLENHARALTYAASREAAARLAQAKAEEAAAQEHYAQLHADCGSIPTLPELEERLAQLRQLQRARELLHSQLLEAVGGSDAEAAQQDVNRYRKYHIATIVFLLLSVLLLGAEAVVLQMPGLFSLGIFLAILSGCALAAAVGTGQRRLILKSLYHFAEPRDWVSRSLDRRDLEQTLSVLSEKLSACTGGMSAAEYEQQLLFQQMARRQEEEFRKELERACALRAALEDAWQPVDAPTRPDKLDYTSSRTRELLLGCANQLQQLQRQLGSCQGQMAVLGDKDALLRELDALNGRIAALEDTCAALELAQTHLSEATAQLQRRFAPRITQTAQSLFYQLTLGKYDRLSLDDELRLSAAAREEIPLRPSLWRSEGTVDQVYLALRLAVARELAPRCPLILDDALIRFDDDRLAAALKVLRREAETKQILLFSCQRREQYL